MLGVNSRAGQPLLNSGAPIAE